MAKYRVDLNSDLGESFGNYKLEANDLIMEHVSSANVACGLHAGDPVVMRHTVELAKKFGVGVGVHPSYPDLQGFGRRKMNMKRSELRSLQLCKGAGSAPASPERSRRSGQCRTGGYGHRTGSV